MNSNPYRTTGIVLYWMAFLCLAFVTKHNIQNIPAKQTAQEQKQRQQEVTVAQEKEKEAGGIARSPRKARITVLPIHRLAVQTIRVVWTVSRKVQAVVLLPPPLTMQ
jgi:hypothetical protein